ncbi:hypothetical protein A2G96_09670 [Cupriavidus nantongensis]|uniref:Uncharacterized protein n=1 Tax=Cupriavidus nantongensis TaxID=1796606 RepID=A0A142JIS4_9BURK|nr:hypothetical protein A2G96_09670 [Cupriavidus nantongensis]
MEHTRAINHLAVSVSGLALTVACAAAVVCFSLYQRPHTASAYPGIAESKALYVGVDEAGEPALCVSGTAYNFPKAEDEELRYRPRPANPDGSLNPVRRCQ